jgi:hypothetical protein
MELLWPDFEGMILWNDCDGLFWWKSGALALRQRQKEEGL